MAIKTEKRVSCRRQTGTTSHVKNARLLGTATRTRPRNSGRSAGARNAVVQGVPWTLPVPTTRTSDFAPSGLLRSGNLWLDPTRNGLCSPRKLYRRCFNETFVRKRYVCARDPARRSPFRKTGKVHGTPCTEYDTLRARIRRNHKNFCGGCDL